MYIPRRLLVTRENGKDVEYSDSDFFALDVPRVVLGEPGAGKSELLKQASEQLGTQIINASTVAAGLPSQNELSDYEATPKWFGRARIGLVRILKTCLKSPKRMLAWITKRQVEDLPLQGR